MALNDDSLADLRRWYFDERLQTDSTGPQDAACEPAEADPIGYEAAWPGSATPSPGIESAGLAHPDLR